MIGLRKFIFGLIVVSLITLTGLLVKDTVIVGVLVTGYLIAYGLFLDYNVKSKNLSFHRDA